MNCHGEAEFAYWMPDIGQFSRVQSPEHDLLDDGDLAPYVCESCRNHMAGSPHWDGDRFYRPEEKLVTDGGTSAPTIVRLLYTFYCHRCGHEWDQQQDVQAPGVEHSPPSVTTRCPECEGQLSANPHAWGRTFEITEVLDS